MKNYHDDPRFRIAHREALIGLGLAIINFIIWYGFAYGLGSKIQVNIHMYSVFQHGFYSCIVGFIVMVILLSLVVRFVFQDISLDEEEKVRNNR